MLLITRERLTAHLLEISDLINLYQQRDPIFLEKVIKWLSQAEISLLELRNPLAGFVAGARGKVIAVHDGFREPQITGVKISNRKASMATAALILSQVEDRLRSTITEIDAKFDVWREKMSQLLALASMKRPIPLPPTEPRQMWLKQVWIQLGQSEEAKGMYGYLNAAMPQADRIHMLDELIQNTLSALIDEQKPKQFRKKREHR